VDFKYYQGPEEEIDCDRQGRVDCSLCGEPGLCMSLEARWVVCPELGNRKDASMGCFACLAAGRFEINHATELGQMKGGELYRLDFANPKRKKPEMIRVEAPPDFRVEALAELRRTPPYKTLQGEEWLIHCNDFMVYLGRWSRQMFFDQALDGDGHRLFVKMTSPKEAHAWEALYLTSDGSEAWEPQYYAFRCLHCGMLRGHCDFD
jgi:uncharacterized protein CbrC (UPF0167 family)